VNILGYVLEFVLRVLHYSAVLILFKQGQHRLKWKVLFKWTQT